MKKLILIVFVLWCSGSICYAQSPDKTQWGEIEESYLSNLGNRIINYFYTYCHYPTSIDDLIQFLEIYYSRCPNIADSERQYWTKMVLVLKNEKKHLRTTIDTGISYYYAYTPDSVEYLKPVEEPFFYLFYDNDTILSGCTYDFMKPCEAVSQIGVYPPDYLNQCEKFEDPLLYDSFGNVLFFSEKVKKQFRNDMRNLRKKCYSDKNYPFFYYVYEEEKVPIRRFVEYQDNILRDYCTGEDISHESFYNEKLTSFLRKYAKKYKCSKIRYMTIHFNPDGKNVRVKKEDFNRIIWKQN